MKLKRILCGLLCLSFLGLSLAVQADPVQGALTVHVTGIKNDNGVIRIALFNSQQTYADKNIQATDAYHRAQLPIKNGEAVWRLTNVPYGVYAIKLYHDEDNSGKLKKSFVGRPTEGIGFSNNPKVGNRTPSFDETKFSVDQPNTDVTIQMVNP